MKKLLVKLFVVAVMLSLVSLSAHTAMAAAWPEKAVTFVVPWSAGGDTDFFARTIAKYLGEELGKTVNVVNTVGGGGSVASNEVKDSEPDGYTFLCFDTALALNHACGIAEFGYEAFSPVCMMAKGTGEYMVTRNNAPYNTVAELIEYSKKNPNTIKFAANTGGTSYYAAVRLQELGAEFNVVNAGSSSERIASLLGEHIDISVNAMGVLAQYLPGTGTGELKVLGCLATSRSKAFPDIALAKDQSVDLAYDMTYNILAPKGTDPEIVKKLSEACGKIILNNKDYAKEIWDAYGAEPFYQDTDEAVATLKAEDDKYMEYAPVFQKGIQKK